VPHKKNATGCERGMSCKHDRNKLRDIILITQCAKVSRKKMAHGDDVSTFICERQRIESSTIEIGLHAQIWGT